MEKIESQDPSCSGAKRGAKTRQKSLKVQGLKPQKDALLNKRGILTIIRKAMTNKAHKPLKLLEYKQRVSKSSKPDDFKFSEDCIVVIIMVEDKYDVS